MAIPYSTRAVLLYVSMPTTGATFFLGTGEDGVTIEEHPEFVPVMNDLAGPRKPFDMMAAGNDAIVSVTLTRWNEPVHAALAMYSFAGVGVRGQEVALARGSLMLTEGRAFSLYAVYPAGVASSIGGPIAGYVNQGLPQGYRFFSCHLMAPLRLMPGTRPYKVQMVFHAMSVFVPVSGAIGGSSNALAVTLTSVGGGGFVTYDNNVAAVAAIPVN